MRLLVALALVSLAFAGCTSPDPEGPDAVPGDGDPDAGIIVQPEWAIGDWWSYEWSDGRTPTFIVTGETAEHWMVDVDAPDIAFEHTQDPVSTIGEVAKTNLDGSQAAGPVAFFQFPLEVGKTWSMEWDQRNFEATVSTITEGVARIEYRNGDRVERTIDFDAVAGWIRNMAAVDANGTTLWEAKLMRSGDTYAGEYTRWDILESLTASAGGFGNLFIDDITVTEAATDVWMRYHVTCNPDGIEGDGGTVDVSFRPEDAPFAGHSERHDCPVDATVEETFEAYPDQWMLQITGAGGTVSGTWMARAQQTFTL